MSKAVKRIAVTGGAGNIAYSLLFRIASGQLLGDDQPVALHILEVPQAQQALEGVCMELEDGAFPLLKEIKAGTEAGEVFRDVDIALLVGAKPRGPGMERGDLLKDNGKIFIAQGEALNAVASKDVKVLVVGNPCNTNCLIAMHRAPNIPRKNFMAMTRLDENRARSQLAVKAGVPVAQVKQVAVWGNHSSTQVPDFVHAEINGKPAEAVIGDRGWLEGEFLTTVQKRGAAIIKARGKSSAASAANAAIDSIRTIIDPTPTDEWHSLAICSDGNPYGIVEDLIYSFPVRSKGDGGAEIVSGLEIDPYLQQKLKASEEELLEEKKAVEHLLGAKV